MERWAVAIPGPAVTGDGLNRRPCANRRLRQSRRGRLDWRPSVTRRRSWSGGSQPGNRRKAESQGDRRLSQTADRGPSVRHGIFSVASCATYGVALVTLRGRRDKGPPTWKPAAQVQRPTSSPCCNLPDATVRFHRRCDAFGVTHVPRARTTNTDSSSTSAADADTSVRAVMTLCASNSIVRDVVPTRVMRPRAST